MKSAFLTLIVWLFATAASAQSVQPVTVTADSEILWPDPNTEVGALPRIEHYLVVDSTLSIPLTATRTCSGTNEDIELLCVAPFPFGSVSVGPHWVTIRARWIDGPKVGSYVQYSDTPPLVPIIIPPIGGPTAQICFDTARKYYDLGDVLVWPLVSGGIKDTTINAMKRGGLNLIQQVRIGTQWQLTFRCGA